MASYLTSFYETFLWKNSHFWELFCRQKNQLNQFSVYVFSTFLSQRHISNNECKLEEKKLEIIKTEKQDKESSESEGRKFIFFFAKKIFFSWFIVKCPPLFLPTFSLLLVRSLNNTDAPALSPLFSQKNFLSARSNWFLHKWFFLRRIVWENVKEAISRNRRWLRILEGGTASW